MTLEEIQLLVLAGRYHYSDKVRTFMEEGWYSEEDLECCIKTATEIYKVERDELKASVDGKKYVILGKDTYGCLFYTCGKIIKDEEGKLYFFITAHKAD
jgi:hypothetical protein